MGFDFFGADVDFRILLQQGVELNPGRYSIGPDGKKVRRAEDPDIVRVGTQSMIGVLEGTRELVLRKGNFPGDKEELPLTFFRSMMTRFQMEMGLSMLPKVEIDIDPPSNDVALALLNSNAFSMGNILAVRFGYSKSPFESFPGKGKEFELFWLLKPEVRIGETISFTLKGLAFGMIQRVQRENRSFLGKTAEQVVRQLALENGFRRVIGPRFEELKGLLAVSGPGALAGLQVPIVQAQEAWEKRKRDWQQAGKTDWAFMNEVLDSIPGRLTFRIEGDALIIDSLISQLSRPPRAIFRWYGRPQISATTGNLERGDRLPVLRVDSDTTFAFLPAASFGVVLNSGYGRDFVRGGGNKSASVPGQDVSNDLNRNIPAQADRTDTSPKVGEVKDVSIGAQKVSPFQGMRGKEGGMQLAQAMTRTPDTREMVKNMAQEAQFFGNFNITIETIGVPTLRPGDIIFVEGFEAVGTMTGKLNGYFLVKRLVHEIGSDGFTTRIEAIRNSTPGGTAFAASPVNSNSRKAPREPVSGVILSPIPVQG